MQNIAVVGLDQLSQDFVRALGGLADRGVRVIGVVDPHDGRAADRLTAEGVRVMSLEEMVALGEGVDIVFDLAGDPELRRRLRQALFASDNQHTVIAPQSVARLMWTLLGESPFPGGDDGGY